MTIDDDILEAMTALRAEYILELPGELRMLSGVLEEARRGGWDKGLLRQATSQAHRLHGTAGSYSFVRISEAAGRIEDALTGIEASWLAPDAAWPEIEQALADMEAAMGEISGKEG